MKNSLKASEDVLGEVPELKGIRGESDTDPRHLLSHHVRTYMIHIHTTPTDISPSSSKNKKNNFIHPHASVQKPYFFVCVCCLFVVGLLLLLLCSLCLLPPIVVCRPSTHPLTPPHHRHPSSFSLLLLALIFLFLLFSFLFFLVLSFYSFCLPLQPPTLLTTLTHSPFLLLPLLLPFTPSPLPCKQQTTMGLADEFRSGNFSLYGQWQVSNQHHRLTPSSSL